MSSTFTPMFDKRASKPNNFNHEKKPRKPRNDKKIQIKVPVTLDEKRLIGKLSLENGYQGEIHPYLDMIFSTATERNFTKYAKQYVYNDTSLYVSTKITNEVHQKIVSLKVEWGLRSIRQAAHRILMNEIHVS
ncbi:MULTISPECIES: hypothetical protein [Metabacillus]|uniref:hypothetical protein n=1 Tax=Metabacillus TaxID=2675233 RepID=UPI000C7FCE64|nr:MULTISPECIES: hypothetical protein [Metabacillus]MCM3443998.1 hypothetical protein [Metabacillus halosaccharovorans]PMC34951.1 hypothetical protein CJ195_20805 [Bacillus sp. UMB0899]